MKYRFQELLDMAQRSSPDACTVWPHAKTAGGYGLVVVGGRREYAHRVVCIRHHGGAPTSTHTDVAHGCGNRGCVNPHHLRWATRSENQLDRRRHGTANAGPDNPMSKLTASQVVEIRCRLNEGASRRDVASAYGVTESNLSYIATGKTWGWM